MTEAGETGETGETGEVEAAEARPKRLELRVAEVVEAGEHPNADRLLVLQIDLGDERRQLVAGLAGVYEPASLVGKRIVVVANLRAAKLRGEVSQGMLLAAHGEERVGLLLAPDAEPGTLLQLAQPATSGLATTGSAEEITIDDFADHEIRATAEGVSVDGERVERPRILVDREAWGTVR